MKLLLTRLKISLRAQLWVLLKPLNFVIAFVSAVAVFGAVLWSLNVSLLWYIIRDAPLSFLEKIEFFGYGYGAVLTSYSTLQSAGLIMFSVLFGVNLVLLIYVIRRRNLRDVPKKSGVGAFVLAVIGGGCIACGASIITPLLVTLGVGSSLFLQELFIYAIWISGVLLIYSTYKLGILAATIRTNDTLTKD